MTEPNKSLGQHWLSDPATLLSIVQEAQITDADTILEVGPGLGYLTKQLASVAARVVSVEFDHDLALQMIARSIPKVEVIEADIRTFDLGALPVGYKVVANIPYYLTNYLLRLMSEARNPPSCAVLLIQKEVAERITAGPGSMSILSVSTQYYHRVSLGIVVPARLFTPPPKVDSQVLIMKRRKKPLWPDVNEVDFFRLVKAGFSQRRKTLHNALSGGLAISKEQALDMLSRADIVPSRRAQELSLDQWYLVYRIYSKSLLLG